MSTLQAVLAIIGGLVALAVLVGGLWAVARSSSQDARIRRLQDENVDLVRRLDWIEPRFRETEQKNELLLQLHNPTAQLERMSTDRRTEFETTRALLEDQSRLLHEIDEKLPQKGH